MISIDHIAVWAEDIEGMRGFYMKYFGIGSSERYVNEKKGFTSYFLSFGEGRTRIELMTLVEGLRMPESRQRVMGLAHFAVSVGGKEAVDALTERLRGDGYTIEGEPRTTGDGCYESVVLDPEGNFVEICE